MIPHRLPVPSQLRRFESASRKVDIVREGIQEAAIGIRKLDGKRRQCDYRSEGRYVEAEYEQEVAVCNGRHNFLINPIYVCLWITTREMHQSLTLELS